MQIQNAENDTETTHNTQHTTHNLHKYPHNTHNTTHTHTTTHSTHTHSTNTQTHKHTNTHTQNHRTTEPHTNTHRRHTDDTQTTRRYTDNTQIHLHTYILPCIHTVCAVCTQQYNTRSRVYMCRSRAGFKFALSHFPLLSRATLRPRDARRDGSLLKRRALPVELLAALASSGSCERTHGRTCLSLCPQAAYQEVEGSSVEHAYIFTGDGLCAYS